MDIGETVLTLSASDIYGLISEFSLECMGIRGLFIYKAVPLLVCGLWL